ncbi:DUF3147 family protein [Herbidospora sp. NEAU-GS84]|uniref:DUF3147 family protein n=1 Tax=Herbidospora solisilvae TaxID=2696284 RepID=A0A7C9J0G6_9ACTN|nr:DUF3147 family protein [Herbidospora solisilvae]NAS20625.1 DUF3147 family protein [Herbidospora solisilvae]
MKVTFRASRLRHTRARDLVVRFVFGAAISVIAGLVGQRWGPLAGGVWLGFPAILGATLTLIEEEEHKRGPAAKDAIGAIFGAGGLTAFAVCVWLLATRLPPWLVLLLALVAWMAVAALLYVVTEGSRSRLRSRGSRPPDGRSGPGGSHRRTR